MSEKLRNAYQYLLDTYNIKYRTIDDSEIIHACAIEYAHKFNDNTILSDKMTTNQIIFKLLGKSLIMRFPSEGGYPSSKLVAHIFKILNIGNEIMVLLIDEFDDVAERNVAAFVMLMTIGNIESIDEFLAEVVRLELSQKISTLDCVQDSTN